MGSHYFRHLTLEFVRVTEAAALASMRWVGRGSEVSADQAAVDAMRKAFDTVSIRGKVVIGEGERDEAPMLYIGEEVGRGGTEAPLVDVALDPLEGTSICARGDVGATSVVAVAEKGQLLGAPDTYMDKLAVGPKAKGLLKLSYSVEENIALLSKALLKPIEDLCVVILDRPRHEKLIRKVRETGVRIQLIRDGDVSAGLATCWESSGVDLLLGIGGAPEGVLTAAAVKCLGGDFQGRLQFRNEEEKKRAYSMNIQDLDKVYERDELVKGAVIFCATGVTDGPWLKGVKTLSDKRILTHSLVMRSDTGTLRHVYAEHDLNRKKL